MTSTLVVETGVGGHAHLHLTFLVDSLFHAGSDVREAVWFYISPETASAMARILPADSMELFRQRWIPTQPKANSPDLNDVSKTAEQVGAGHLLFLFIDSFIYAIARRRSDLSISGVWFRPNYHYSSTGMIHEDARQRAVAILKNMTARILCVRRRVRRLFVLDESAAEYATKYFRTDKIRYIPDPYAFDSMARIHRTASLAENRRVFLIAGALSKRKGILPVLEALTLLDEQTQTHIRLRLIGRIGAEDRFDILSAIDTARRTTSTEIDHVDEFVSDEAMDVALIESDMVLLLYQQFIGSSGMLIRAALHKKPVIATKFGLVGMIVRDQKLGLTVDPYSPRAIANAIISVLKDGHIDFDYESAGRFAARHKPTQYAEQLRDLIVEVARDEYVENKKQEVYLSEHQAVLDGTKIDEQLTFSSRQHARGR